MMGSVMRPIDMDTKKVRHIPYYASPYDLGIEPTHGFADACSMASGCGRSFNAYGFTPCMQYPHIGRLLGRDVHSAHPKFLGDFEICKHCICSLSRVRRLKLQKGIVEGKVEYPTKTYREGIERETEHPTKMTDFLDRFK